MAAPRTATAHGEGILQANGTLAREKPLRITKESETYAPAAHTTEHGSRTLALLREKPESRELCRFPKVWDAPQGPSGDPSIPDNTGISDTVTGV